VKALLLAGGASTFAIAGPAMAQDDGEGASDDDDARIVVTGSRIQRQDYEANSPIVTVDEEFFQQSSTAAVEQQLNKLPQFVVSQSSTANNASESGLLPAGGDIQPSARNTPGAATISLRGVGSNRTLVLIDGRRGVPTNASGAVDVSMIPSAALERAEIISGGASATYGADAVAGVTNFILKNNYEGLELDGQFGISQEGIGAEYQLGGIIGSDFADGRGNVSMAMSWNKREEVFQRENKFYQKLWADPTTTSGAAFWPNRPSISLGFFGGLLSSGLQPNGVCEGSAQGCVLTDYFAALGADPDVPNNYGTISVNEDGTLFIPGSAFSNNYAARGGFVNYKPWPEADEGFFYKRAETGQSVGINALTPQTIPTTRYNFLARGNYEINDWIGVFGSGMFSHTTTHTIQEGGIITWGNDIIVPWGDDVFDASTDYGFVSYDNPYIPSSVIHHGDTFGFVPYNDPTPGDLTDNPTNPAFQSQFGYLNCAGFTSGLGGCTDTETFQQAVPADLQDILNARTAPDSDIQLFGYMPLPRETFGDTRVYQMTGGLEGSVPGTDWTWEAFVSHGISATNSRQTGFYSLERARAVFATPNFGQGFDFTGNPDGGGGLRRGFGGSSGTCTTGLNYFGAYTNVSQDCFDAITATRNVRQTNRQTIAEANLQGGAFELPAGQLRFAAGFSYREQRFTLQEETLTSAGTSFNDSILGIYPGTNMHNVGYNVHELYGELLIPVLHDLPLIQEFNLEIGGRMSDYNSTGTSYTWKILGDWRVNDWLRIRGGFNRAERTPNINELLLAPLQEFGTDPIGDACSDRHFAAESANPDNNPDFLDVIAVCQALIERDNGGNYLEVTDPDSYYYYDTPGRRPTGGGFSFAYTVGNQYYRENIDSNVPAIKPETADTWTLGAVIQSPASSGPLSRLNLTVDYFNINIKDPIGRQLAGGIVLQCISSQYNPAVDGVAGGAQVSISGDAEQDKVAIDSAINNAAVRAAAQAAIQNSTCPLVPRTGQNGALSGADVTGVYLNDGGIKLSGIDANLSWAIDAGPGTIFTSIAANYMIDFKLQAFAGQPWIDYVGTTGTNILGVNSGSSFEYRIFGTLGYSWGPANMTLQWNHIPATDNGSNANFRNGLSATPVNNTGLPAYNLFSLNSSYQVNDTLTFRLGIDNLFNKRPPLTGRLREWDPSIGQVQGGGYSLFHDIQGRRFSLGANLQF
jgi:outer membrane receptor protein involved in Fe transport